MKRPMILLAAAVLSGILTGLPEVPVITRAAASASAVLLLVIFALGNRGKVRAPLFFLLTAAVLLYLGGFCRGRKTAAYYGSEEFAAFFHRYEASNPGEFDYAVYLKGLDITDEESRVRYKNREYGRDSFISPLLASVSAASEAVLKRDASEHDFGIWKAVLLGDRSSMQEDVKKLYQDAGIAHLLAVSGIHVSLAGMGLYTLLRKKMKLRTGIAVSVSLSAALFYVLLTGASASSVRALLMLAAGLFCLIPGRRYDAGSALSLAAVLLAFRRPYLLLQSGFQLSFTALAGICAAAELEHCGKLREKLKRRRDSSRNKETGTKTEVGAEGGTESATESGTESGTETERFLKGEGRTARFLLSQKNALLSSVCVSLLTLPVIAASFYQVPVYSVFLNLAVIPLMTVVMLSGFGTLAAGFIRTAAGTGAFAGAALLLQKCCIAPGHYVMKLYETLSSLSMSLPFSRVLIGAPAAGTVIVYYLLLAALFCYLARVRNTTGLALPLLFCAYLLSFRLLSLRPAEGVSVTVFDVGQGDSFLISTGDAYILLDCGSSGYERAGSRIVEPCLLSKGIDRLDLVILTHADSDHSNGILYLLEKSDIQVGALMLPALAESDEKYDMVKKAAGQLPVLQAEKDLVCRSGSAELRCLYCETDPEAMKETNRESAVFLLRTEGFSMLFTGDMTESEENRLLAAEQDRALLKADILKCSHHGSKNATSEAFLEACDPELAILSYGEENRYGHPSAEVKERLRRLGLTVFSTAESGAVRIEGSGSGFRISGFR